MLKTPKLRARDPMERLVADSVNKSFPKVGDVIKGVVVSSGKNEIIIDIPGVTTGIVRGWEVEDESGQMTDLSVGTEVQATVLDLENEKGMMELSFRVAGHRKAWDHLKALKDSGEIVSVKTTEANKGGLIVELGRVLGFLPVSQLNSEHYPRVEGGNKTKILDRLKDYVGQEFKVKVIDLDETEEKLIVSEKAIDAEEQMAAIAGYAVGEEVEVNISGIVDFGLFVELPVRYGEGESAPEGQEDHQTVEGLVHISEVSWQRVDDLKDLFKTGDSVKAKIIEIADSKVSLSIKRLLPDPWQDAAKHFKVNQVVDGKVVKINDFGAFVEMEHNIHGLAHISGLGADINQAPLEVGKTYQFKIINMEPEAHRLGLSRQVANEEAPAAASPAPAEAGADKEPEQPVEDESTPEPKA